MPKLNLHPFESHDSVIRLESDAFGAVFDNPDLIATCVIGDGEVKTGHPKAYSRYQGG